MKNMLQYGALAVFAIGSYSLTGCASPQKDGDARTKAATVATGSMTDINYVRSAGRELSDEEMAGIRENPVSPGYFSKETVGRSAVNSNTEYRNGLTRMQSQRVAVQVRH